MWKLNLLKWDILCASGSQSRRQQKNNAGDEFNDTLEGPKGNTKVAQCLRFDFVCLLAGFRTRTQNITRFDRRARLYNILSGTKNEREQKVA